MLKRLQPSGFRDLIVVLALAGCLLGCRDTKFSNEFPNRKAAQAQDFVRRGWLPDVLPEEAGPIVEVHDLDTNARCSRSEFPAHYYDDINRALEAEGFLGYNDLLPEPPFRSCPFSGIEASRADAIWSRATSAGLEFAALEPTGVLYFWSSGS